MPNAAQPNNDEPIHVILAGASGGGKSTLAYHSPGPIAALLLDKSTIDIPPNVEKANIFYKKYPPAILDLTNDKHGRARNIADAIIRDIQVFRDHFTTGKEIVLKTSVDGKETETWPTPKTLVLEGGDFLAQHILNLICARHGKANPSDFGNPFEAWGLRLVELHAIYDMLTYFPCNLVVTTGVHSEKRNTKVNGRMESEDTGILLPNLGGAFDTEGPRKFHSSLYLYSENGVYKARTRDNMKFKGFKLGGVWGAPEIIDITLDKAKDPWQAIFKRS